ncbi:MAG: hypothetical protein H7281_00955 [Bacteriovorax sp.]|nr:hypothetical protein [Bacteriovorax sp.]
MASTVTSPAIVTVGDEKLVELENDLHFRMDFISLMLQVGDDFERDAKIDSSIFNRPEQLSKLLQEKMKIYQYFFLEALKIPNDKKEIFKKTFLSFDWRKIVPILKKSHIGAEIFFKKKGFGLGLAIMAGILTEYLVPAILIHLGLAHLIPLSMLTPWSTIYSFIPGNVQKLKIRKMLSDSLGGKIQVEAYQKQQETLLKNLHMHSPNDLIFPVGESEGMIKSIVVPKVSWENRLLQRLGIKKSLFGYEAVQSFLSENSISDPYINWIVENNKLTKDMKTAFITGHLLSLNDENISSKIYQSFSENIITIKNNSSWEDIWNWTLMMKKIKSIDELFHKVGETPASIRPKEVAIIWENVLLPQYAIKFDLSYSEARRMFDQFEVLKAKLNTSESLELDEKTKNEIYNYIKKIIGGKSFDGCKNSPLQINQFLLRKSL